MGRAMCTAKNLEQLDLQFLSDSSPWTGRLELHDHLSATQVESLHRITRINLSQPQIGVIGSKWPNEETAGIRKKTIQIDTSVHFPTLPLSHFLPFLCSEHLWLVRHVQQLRRQNRHEVVLLPTLAPNNPNNKAPKCKAKGPCVWGTKEVLFLFGGEVQLRFNS